MMRLRLVVKRYSLPDTPVAWAIDTSSNPTISQLLEQVNEIIPLESGGDWGLEDYSVEIKGSGTDFECLHFQPVVSILHEDDEIIIRPLLSLDLKLRKVSGRIQITSDGRHLVDGTTFGRPRPRGILDRPAVDIPPRKRRRITIDEDPTDSASNESLTIEDQLRFTDDEAGNRQLVVRANFEDDDDDSENDEDFQPHREDENEDITTDSEGLLEDGSVQSNSDASNSEDSLAYITNEAMRANVRKLREAFPTVPVAVCKHILLGSNGDLSGAWEALTKAYPPAKPRKAILTKPSNQETESLSKIKAKKLPSALKKPVVKLKGPVEAISEDDEEGTDLEDDGSDPGVEALAKHYDQHGLPRGSISTTAVEGAASKNKRKFSDSNQTASDIRRSSSATSSSKSVRFVDEDSSVKSLDEAALDDEDESDDEDFDNDSSSVSSDSSSNSNEESDSEDKDEGSSSDDDSVTRGDNVVDSDATSSSSSSYSGSEPEETSSKTMGTTTAKTTPTTKASGLVERSGTLQPKVAPGEGKRATNRRNIRRRRANEYKRLQANGCIPAGTTFAQFKKSEGEILEEPAKSEGVAERSLKLERDTERAAAKEAEFRARRDELLSSLASGGVEVGPLKPAYTITSSLDVEMAGPMGTFKPSPENASSVTEETAAPNVSPSTGLAVPGTSTPQSLRPEFPETTTSNSSPTVRKKLNIGAAGRLVFGALGVRTPKTKEEQEKVRNDLMKHVRPVKTMPKAENDKRAEIAGGDEDLETWRQFITLRGVECCHEGVVLSDPPFPFVQRWDPQQQGSYQLGLQKGKGKKQKRNNAQYYDNEQHLSKRQKYRYEEPYDESYEQYSGVGQDGEMNIEKSKPPMPQNILYDGVGGEANDQLIKDAQEAANFTGEDCDKDDLLALPKDMSTLTVLIANDIKVGIVIAFKQLTMSEETNWQPQVSGYRTAKVTKVDENGQIELTLACRDRESKYYDDDTGKRIFGKFDVPVDEDQDDGWRSLTFAELLDPKLVQATTDISTFPVNTPLGKAIVNTDEFIALDHEGRENINAEFSKAARPVQEPRHRLEHLPDNDVRVSSLDVPAVTPEINIAYTLDKEISSSKADDDNEDASSTSIRGGYLAHSDLHHEYSISGDDRADISVTIKEAGFRSEVPSSVTQALTQHLIPLKGSYDNDAEAQYEEFYSPHSNGDSDPPLSPRVDIIPSSPSITSSPTRLLATSSEMNTSVAVEETEETIPSSVHYPKLSVPSSLTSEIADCGHQPDFPTPGENTLERFDANSSLSEHDSLNKEGSSPPATYSNGNDNILPPSSIRQSIISNPISPVEIFPTMNEIFSTAPSRSRPARSKKKKVSSAAPDTRSIWPASREKLAPVDKAKDSYEEAMDVLDAKFNDEEEYPSQATSKAMHLSTTVQPKVESPSWPAKRQRMGNMKAITNTQRSGSQFVLPSGSQQVDLTSLSSDVEQDTEKDREADTLYEDLFGKPDDILTGPDLVTETGNLTQNQTRVRRQSGANPRVVSKSQAKAKSIRRKTTTRF